MKATPIRPAFRVRRARRALLPAVFGAALTFVTLAGAVAVADGPRAAPFDAAAAVVAGAFDVTAQNAVPQMTSGRAGAAATAFASLR